MEAVQTAVTLWMICKKSGLPRSSTSDKTHVILTSLPYHTVLQHGPKIAPIPPHMQSGDTRQQM